MLRVDEIVLRELRLPLVEPFEISSGLTTERRIFLLELRHPDGVVAWSECVARSSPNYSPETVDTAWMAIREWLAPRVLGREFREPAEVGPVLEDRIQGHRMAKAAVEMGLWGLAAELRGEPLARVVGGGRERVETGISVGLHAAPEVLVERAREVFRQGYRKLKMKVRPGADVAHVRAVREALGPEAPLAIDANAAYTESPDDLEALEGLDALGLLMIEQPLEAGDLVRHARLQERLRTPICLDESVDAPARAEDMVALGSGRIVNIKPGRVGGFGASLAIAETCHRAGMGVWCGGMLESGVGRAYNVALASRPEFGLPGDLSPSRRYWRRDIVDPEWTMDADGGVRVPLDRPGLGVEVDRDRVEGLVVRSETLRAEPGFATPTAP